MKEDLIKLLKNIKNDHNYITSISDFIGVFRAHAKQVSEVVTAHFVPENAEIKVLYFFIAHEVMCRSKDSVSELF
jgi:hypothetical protein